jgi:hypothetical protein
MGSVLSGGLSVSLVMPAGVFATLGADRREGVTVSADKEDRSRMVSEHI